MAKQKKPQEPEDSEPEMEHYGKFEAATKIAEVGFQYEYWPAWVMTPREEIIAPIVRFYIGDSDDNILFKENVLLSALIEMTQEINNAILYNLSLLNGYKTHSIHLPSTKEEIIAQIGDIEAQLKEIKDYLSNQKIVSTDELKNLQGSD